LAVGITNADLTAIAALFPGGARARVAGLSRGVAHASTQTFADGVETGLVCVAALELGAVAHHLAGGAHGLFAARQ
jgi:uncharacterized membrane protein YjjB (DUF3815 family)